MGYTTDFEGSFHIEGGITEEQVNYINNFSNTRRVKLDVNYLNEHLSPKEMTNVVRPGLEPGPDMLGIDGEYYIGGVHSSAVVDNNTPPGTQPSLWCQWIIEYDEYEHFLVWDGGEKFNNYVEWLEYMIEHFFKPWGLKLNGEVEWFGEDLSDRGKIVVKNNVVKTYDGEIIYKDEIDDVTNITNPCPHCGKEIELKEEAVYNNVEIYGRTVRAATECCNKLVMVSRRILFNHTPCSDEYGEDDWGHEFGDKPFDSETLYRFKIMTGKYSGKTVEGRFLNEQLVQTVYGNFTFVENTIRLTSKERPSWMKNS